MVALVFDLIERTLRLYEVEENEIGNGDEPVGEHTCCYFETWGEAARALEAAARQAQYHTLVRSGKTPGKAVGAPIYRG